MPRSSRRRSALRAIVFLCIGVCLAAFVATPVRASEKPSAATEVTGAQAIESLRAKRQTLAEEIARLSAAAAADMPEASATESDEKNPASSVDPAPAADAVAEKPKTKTANSPVQDERLRLLKSIDAVYAQQQTRLEQQRQLQSQTKEAESELEKLDKFKPNEPKPYSFLLLENLQDQLAVEEDRAEAISAEVKAAEQLLKGAHGELDDNESSRRKLANKKEKTAGDADERAQKLAQLELEGTLARAKIGLRQAEIEVQNLQLALSKLRQKQLDKKIEVVKDDVKFSAEDRDEQLKRIVAAEAEVKRKRKAAESRFQQLDAEQQNSQRELAAQKAPQKVLEAATSAWRAAADGYQTEIVLLDQQLENLDQLRHFWKLRYELASGTVDHKKLQGWLEELDEFLDELKATSRSLENRLETVRRERAVAPSGEPADAQMPHDQVAEDRDLAKWKTFRDARLQEVRELCEQNLADVAAEQRSLGRFRDDLKSKLKATADNWNTAGEFFKSVLGYQVAEVDSQSITVSRLLVLVAFILGGVLLAYCISRLIGGTFFRYIGLHRGAATALRSIAFYVMCMVFGVLSFQLLHIPVAAFAFLGGAAAIAIGFGSQDIMNNFMSGVILLVEQPIRVGDVVQIGEEQGLVQHIGLRSTRLQTEANHELIVPNKTLIDEQVRNLTLSDNFVQTFVAVTLERTVPIQESKRKMLKVAFGHPLVIKSPRPVVLLKEVETSWLTFEVHFSLQHQSFMKCAIVQSEILEGISELFPAEGETSAETGLDDDGDPESGEPAGAGEPGDEAIEGEPATTPDAGANGVATGSKADSPASAQMAQLARAAVAKEIRRARRSLRMKT